MPVQTAAAPSDSQTAYLFRRVVAQDVRDPVAMPIGAKDSKGYQPRQGEFMLDEFYVVNHGKQADDRWTLAHLTELPKLVSTPKHGKRWQCKVMMYARNGRAQQKQKFLPERRRGTAHGWETVNCQSLSFLAAKLPGRPSNRELTEKHQTRLSQILQEWDEAVESEREDDASEEESDNAEAEESAS